MRKQRITIEDLQDQLRDINLIQQIVVEAGDWDGVMSLDLLKDEVREEMRKAKERLH